MLRNDAFASATFSSAAVVPLQASSGIFLISSKSAFSNGFLAAAETFAVLDETGCNNILPCFAFADAVASFVAVMSVSSTFSFFTRFVELNPHDFFFARTLVETPLKVICEKLVISPF